MSKDYVLARLEPACRMLAEAKDAPTAKKVADMGHAMEDYAKRRKLGRDAEDKAHAVVIDAETLMGEFLKTAELRHGSRGIGKSEVPKGNSTPRLSEVGITKKESSRGQALAEMKKEAPELHQAVRENRVSVSKARKEIKVRLDKEKMEEAAKEIGKKSTEKDFELICDMRCTSMELLMGEVKPDVVITDPPYDRSAIELCELLSRFSKNVPVVAVMMGQTYLPQVMEVMVKHLDYRWTMAYLTSGGQSVQQWERKVNTFWKPVLVFGKSLGWIGDVCRSDANDNDKRFHKWGQSMSGMVDLVGRLVKPGQLVCDPFMGAGTTALAALQCGCRFVGCDINPECVKDSELRAKAFMKDKLL